MARLFMRRPLANNAALALGPRTRVQETNCNSSVFKLVAFLSFATVIMHYVNSIQFIRQQRAIGHLHVAICIQCTMTMVQDNIKIIGLHRKEPFANYVKFSLQYSKR